MRFSLKHLFFVAFLIAFALGVRALAIAIENDAVTGGGVLAAAFLASFGFTIFGTEIWKSWSIGVATTTTMCVADVLERVYHSPAMKYLWKHPIHAQYAADLELGMIATIALTCVATIVGGIGVGMGVVARNITRKSPSNISNNGPDCRGA